MAQKKLGQADEKVQKENNKHMHHIRAEILKPDGKKRNGKGFSKGEVGKAGLNTVDARRIGLPVDPRRKTIHDENVECIRSYADKEKAKVKSKPKAIRLEGKEKAKS